MKRTALFFLVLSCSAHLAAYTIAGSKTMYDLNIALTTKFQQEHPGAKFAVSDVGTGKGIEDVISGAIDVAAITRSLRAPEALTMRKVTRGNGATYPVAREGISIYVHPQNRLEALTLTQLAGIFSGRITNWKEAGGPDAPIHVYAFDKSTGRYWYLAESVMKGEKFAPSARFTDEMPAGATGAQGLAAKEQQMLKWVSSDPLAIGFGDLKKMRVVRPVKIFNGNDAYWPTPDDVASGRYPLARTLSYLLQRPPSGELLQYIDWVAQQDEIIRSYGFVPVK